MAKSNILYIDRIQEDARHIEKYIGRFDTIEEALSDDVTYDAVIRRLQTLSESAQRLSEDFKQSRPNIPWGKISGFRNILVHDYLNGIDHESVIGVITIHLPALLQQLNQPKD